MAQSKRKNEVELPICNRCGEEIGGGAIHTKNWNTCPSCLQILEYYKEHQLDKITIFSLFKTLLSYDIQERENAIILHKWHDPNKLMQTSIIVAPNKTRKRCHVESHRGFMSSGSNSEVALEFLERILIEKLRSILGWPVEREIS